MYIMQKFGNLQTGDCFYLPDKSGKMNLERSSLFIKTDLLQLTIVPSLQVKVTKSVQEKGMFNAVVVRSLNKISSGYYAFFEDSQNVFEEGSC